MIHYYRYLFVKIKAFNYSELHFSEVTCYKIHTLVSTRLKCVGVRFWQETVLHVNFQAKSKRPWNNAVKPAISTWCQLHSYTDSSSATLCSLGIFEFSGLSMMIWQKNMQRVFSVFLRLLQPKSSNQSWGKMQRWMLLILFFYFISSVLQFFSSNHKG